MSKRRLHPGYLAISLLAGLLALGLLAHYGLESVEQQWRRRLQTCSDEAVPAEFVRLAKLGDRATAIYVEALGSQRAVVAWAARQALTQRVNSWEMLAPRQVAVNLATLIDELGRRVETYNSPTRLFASDLALRTLLWPPDDHGPQRRQLIAACEKILRATASERRSLDPQRLADERRGLQGAVAYDYPGADDLAAELRLGRAVAEMPGGGLPVDSFDHPQLPRVAIEDAKSAADAAVPDEESSAMRPARLRPPGLFTPAIAEMAPLEIPATQERPADTADAAGPEMIGQSDGPSRRSKPTATAAPPEEDNLVVRMRELNDSNQAVAREAEAELSKRGFGTVQLALARQLTSPDAHARRQLAELLPRMPGINAGAWLIWLSRDEDPEVRLATVSVIASSTDPDLLARVREMAQSDPDERVQRQGERLSKPSRRATQRRY